MPGSEWEPVQLLPLFYSIFRWHHFCCSPRLPLLTSNCESWKILFASSQIIGNRTLLTDAEFEEIAERGGEGEGGQKWINAQQMADDGTVKKTIHRAILSANMEMGSLFNEIGNCQGVFRENSRF
ncbi:hypothetical protein CEXT_144341 [Caerostris extrusa]|uniref:Uncharacterized protein n=1 Tax=Caerostris extrusa TaxID=172846 RepID=A0AAV4Y7M5_CAEEX|nr:hypothetical protein CEXT_144341 [Caerostris extrusa]